MRRRTTVLTAIAAVVVAGGSYVGYRLSTGGEVTEVGVDRALERFRDQTGPATSVASLGPVVPVAGTTAPAATAVASTTVPTSTTTSGTVRVVAATLPEPGVYQYATTGSDQVDTLGGARHDYPSITTLTVVPSGCGVRLRWDVAVERWNSWDWCLEGDAVRLQAWFAYHEFFDVAGENAYTCDGEARPLDAPAGTRWTMTCRMEDRTTSTYVATVVERTTLPVAGSDVPVLHVRYEVDVAGESTGAQAIDSWYRTTDGLVVREQLSTATVQPTVIGEAHFEEVYSIDLLTPTPAS